MRRHLQTVERFSFALVLLWVLTLSVDAAQNAVLDWTPSPDAKVVGYNVYYGLATGGFSQKISVENVSSVEITGLAAGENYHFAVTARDAQGNESAPTETVSFVVPQLQPIILTTQVYLDESEKPTALGIEATTDSSAIWQFQYSFDLLNWIPYSNGSGANAFTLVPYSLGQQSQMFFRLLAY